MALIDLYDGLTARLKAVEDYVWPTLLRLIMFWEIWESGVEKFTGQNWFGYIPTRDWQQGFPWPFSELSVDLNWLAATWGELVFSVMILLGLFTRFAALSLIVLVAVAISSTHWPNDWTTLSELWDAYAISYRDGYGFKLGLLFILLLIPLVFHGGGRLSLDHILLKMTRRSEPGEADLAATGMALLVLGISLVFIEAWWGVALLAGAALCLGLPVARSRG